MLYAKCIYKSQIAKDKKEFEYRKDEENHVYCVGEITESHEKMENLYCVPLNFIYDCLKYGDYIAVIDMNDNKPYINKSSYMGLEKASKSQYVTNIINAYSKEGIDFVFSEVKDSQLIHEGYIEFLPQNLQDYFHKLKNNNGI